MIYTINCGCHRAGTCTILDTAMNIKKIHTVNGLKKVNVLVYIKDIYETILSICG